MCAAIAICQTEFGRYKPSPAALQVCRDQQKAKGPYPDRKGGVADPLDRQVLSTRLQW